MKGILVGLGGRGQSWIQVCRRASDVELVGYVEPVDEQRKAVAEKLDLPSEQLFATFDEAIQSVNADFALDITPPAAHEAVALEVFDAGLNLLQEKPLSDDFEAAVRIVRASEKAGCTHMVTQNYRFGPVPRTTHRLLKEGVIGKPEQVAVGFSMPWATRSGTHYTLMAYPLLKDMGIHHFDLLRYVFNREPVRVNCTTWNPSWGWHAGDASHVLYIQFTDGLSGIHHAFGSSVGRQSPWNGDWHIDGPEGSLTWENDDIYLTRSHPPDAKKRERIPHDTLAFTGQDACLAEFVSAIGEAREPECSGRDNLKSLALVFAAVQSAAEGRPVEIADLIEQ